MCIICFGIIWWEYDVFHRHDDFLKLSFPFKNSIRPTIPSTRFSLWARLAQRHHSTKKKKAASHLASPASQPAQLARICAYMELTVDTKPNQANKRTKRILLCTGANPTRTRNAFRVPYVLWYTIYIQELYINFVLCVNMLPPFPHLPPFRPSSVCRPCVHVLLFLVCFKEEEVSRLGGNLGGWKFCYISYMYRQTVNIYLYIF